MEQIRIELGKYLKKAREKAQLIQVDVAELSGIHVNYYSRIERGDKNPSFEKLYPILKALKIEFFNVFSS